MLLSYIKLFLTRRHKSELIPTTLLAAHDNYKLREHAHAEMRIMLVWFLTSKLTQEQQQHGWKRRN